MLQTNSQRNSEAPPHDHHHKHHEDPNEQLMMSLSESVKAVDARVTTLEAKSGEGRESLTTGLKALKEATNTASAEHDAAKARVASAEGAISALEDVVSQNNAGLRTEVGKLRSEFEKLGKAIGQHWSAMLESWSTQGDPQGGGALVAQVTALEGRCNKLEAESGAGRQELKAELDGLEKQIADVAAGGAGSLDYTTDRVSSAQQQISALAETVDEQGAELTTRLAELKKKLGSTTKSVGSLLAHAHKDTKLSSQVDDPTGGGGSVLPLTSRIKSLEKRAAMLEGKSNEGRGDLEKQLNKLTEILSTMKDGGVKSLAYTVVRVGSVETDIGSLTAEVEKQKAEITAETAKLETMLAGLNSKVGGEGGGK